jgi:catechol 2,3-dioxygenase-like lactoylglutathione lyase family enzyme
MKHIIKTISFLIMITMSMSISAQTDFEQNGISVGVIVSDLEASKTFYTEIVGMKEVPGFSVTGDIGKRSGLTGGLPFDVTVLKLEDSPTASQWKLMSFKKDATHPKQKHIQDDTGMQYITIFPKNIALVIERIKKNNIPTLGDTPIQLPDGKTFVLIQDPDGTFVELIGD